MASKFIEVPLGGAMLRSLPLHVVFFITIAFTVLSPDVVLWLPKQLLPESVGWFKNPSRLHRLPLPWLHGTIHGMATAIRNFHLPLPEPIYRRLRDAAERTNQPATTLARYAIESWLREHRRTMVREAIARYAVDAAGSREDLDEAQEAASLEVLREPKPRRKKRERKR